MVTDVHPLVYVMHIIFFVWSAVLLGAFAHTLRFEVLTHGTLLTPRSFFCAWLCVSAAIFLTLEIDPWGGLGIYSIRGIKFLEWVQSSVLLDASSCALYLYLIVLYRQHLDKVPRPLYLAWAVMNVTATSILLLFCIVGSATNNIFWFGMATLIVIFHQFVLAILLHVSLVKITAFLKAVAEKGSQDSSFKAAIRKMQLIRIMCVVIVSSSISNQIFGTESFIERLKWGVPLDPYLVAELLPAHWVPQLIVCIAHTVLLYVVRRPQQRFESTKVDRIELSVSHSSSQATVNPASA